MPLFVLNKDFEWDGECVFSVYADQIAPSDTTYAITPLNWEI